MGLFKIPVLHLHQEHPVDQNLVGHIPKIVTKHKHITRQRPAPVDILRRKIQKKALEVKVRTWKLTDLERQRQETNLDGNRKYFKLQR
jgi:hypothetical protein